jgi:hypothetical protein
VFSLVEALPSPARRVNSTLGRGLSIWRAALDASTVSKVHDVSRFRSCSSSALFHTAEREALKPLPPFMRARTPRASGKAGVSLSAAGAACAEALRSTGQRHAAFGAPRRNGCASARRRSVVRASARAEADRLSARALRRGEAERRSQRGASSRAGCQRSCHGTSAE